MTNPQAHVDAVNDQQEFNDLVKNSQIETILQNFEDNLKVARNVPFSDLVLVDRQDILMQIKEAKTHLPEELRQARWIIQQNRQLHLDTLKEIEDLKHRAEVEIIQMVDDHAIVQEAKEKAQAIIADANNYAKDVHDQTMAYVESVLTKLENDVTEMLIFIQKNKKESK